MKKLTAGVAAASLLITLVGCAAPAETGPTEFELALKTICVDMQNKNYRSDLYSMFSEDNLTYWKSSVSSEAALEFETLFRPVVEGQFEVGLKESSSTFFGPSKVASFPALAEVQIRCSELGLPVKLSEKWSSYVD